MKDTNQEPAVAQNFQEQLNQQQQALAKIYSSVEQTRKMIMWSGILTATLFLIPLIVGVIAIPKIIGTFNSTLGVSQGSHSIIPNLGDSLKNLQDSGLLGN